MLLKVHSQNPEKNKISKAVEALQGGGIIIYPTDTVYALGCALNHPKAIERICLLKGIKPKKANFSFIFSDLSHLSDYTVNVNTPVYKILKKYLPGPFTFILKANNKLPKLLYTNKKTIGIRIPDNKIVINLIAGLDAPLLSTSLHHEDEILDYLTDPEEIYNRYNKLVDMVIDGGVGGNMPSTIVDLTNDAPEILREGKGVWEE